MPFGAKVLLQQQHVFIINSDNLTKYGVTFMKTKRVLCSMLPVLFFSASSLAADASRYYLKPYTGLSYMNDVSNHGDTTPIEIELEQGMVLGAAFGYRYNTKIAVELAWEYRSNDSESTVGASTYPAGNYASNIFYLNTIYFFDSFGTFTPYAGAGVGWVQEIDIDLESAGIENSFSNSGTFTYQGFAGVEYKFSSAWSAHTELRHAGGKSGDLKNEQTADLLGDFNYKPFTWQVGVKYSF